MLEGPEDWKSLSAAESVTRSSPVSTGPAETATDLNIRMSMLHFLRVYMASVGVAALGSGGLMLRSQLAARPENAGLVLRTFLWLAIPALAVVTLYAFRIRVRVRGDEVAHFGWLKTIRFSAHTAERAFKYSFEQMSETAFRLFVVRDTSGRCALALFGMAWKDSDLDRLTARLGLRQIDWESASAYIEGRRDCPAGGLPLFVQHPVIYTILCIPIGLALAIGTLMLVFR